MKIAAIDIGTNSVHMIVVLVRPDLSFEIIDREKTMVRLGAGGLDGRALTETAMTAALHALSTFRRLAESHGVDEIIASATSAVREANNAEVFLSDVQRQTGIRVMVISGTEEARLIHLAAAYGVDVGEGRAVVIDIGGGSVEITAGTAATIERARSFKIGVIRLTERFVRSDPLSPADERRLVKHIEGTVGDWTSRLATTGFDRVIGTSGTILSLGALASSRPGGSDDLRNRRVTAKQLHRLRKRLLKLNLEERLRIPGLDPRRADLAVAGSVLLDTILRRLGASELTLCDLALREGLILDYVRRHAARIDKVERYPDVRRRSVIELAERCNYSPAHGRQVAELALAIFDQSRSLHGLTDTAREWLEYGALLHDVGEHISHARHHRHSYYLIKHGGLRGFDPEEIEAIALITRYHRRSTPKRAHDGYADLPAPTRRAVKILAAIVRLAEGLDRSHAQSVTGVALQPLSDAYVLQVRTAGDVELELWAARRQVGPFEAVLGRPLRIEAVEMNHAEQPLASAHVSRNPDRRGGHRRLRQDHAARPARQVAPLGGASGLRH